MYFKYTFNGKLIFCWLELCGLQTGYLDNGDLLRVVKSFLQKKPAKSIYGFWLWMISSL